MEDGKRGDNLRIRLGCLRGELETNIVDAPPMLQAVQVRVDPDRVRQYNLEQLVEREHDTVIIAYVAARTGCRRPSASRTRSRPASSVHRA